MMWDVMGGVARRSWARNENAVGVSAEYNRGEKPKAGGGHITLPYLADDSIIESLIK
jgi:urocanate hydratase